MAIDQDELMRSMDTNEMLTMSFDVCCKWREHHQDYRVEAVSEEHAKNIAIVVFLEARDMDQDFATFLSLSSSEDTVRLFPGLQVVAELSEGAEA